MDRSDETGGVFNLPLPQGGELRIDALVAFKACSRLPELAALTAGKLPEFLSALVAGQNSARKALRLVTAERARGRNFLRRQRSKMLVDLTDDILMAKGLTTSMAMRQSVIDDDPAIKDMEDKVEAAEELHGILKDRVDSLHEGIMAAKKIAAISPDNEKLNTTPKPEPFSKLAQVKADEVPDWMKVGEEKIKPRMPVRTPINQQLADEPLPPGFSA